MLTRIYATSSAAIDLDAKPTWRATAGGQVGGCTISIPRNSAAWDQAIIFESGRYAVEILTRYGTWRGISSDSPTYSARGIEVDVEPIEAWTTIRNVVDRTTFYAAPAGLVARQAVRQAMLGHDGMPITLGSFLIAPPLVDLEFTGQALSAVLAELTELTGQEWYIDNNLQFHWTTRQGLARPFVITDDGRLFGQVRMESGSPGEVIEIDRVGRRFTAIGGESSRLWPDQEVERV